MSKKMKKRLVAAALSFLLILCMAVSAFAQENNGNLGGATGDTEIWAGVTVDYMFPLRYEVYDPKNQPLSGVSIEHYDHNAKEYVYVGRTNENGIWETQIPADYFNNVIIGGAQGVSVADTRALYEGNGELRHRLSKNGFLIVEGRADYTIELNEKREQVIVVRVTMQYEDSASSSTPGPSDPGTSGTNPPASVPNSRPNGGGLPQTGVPSYWIFLAVGSLLLLLAALIISKILYDEKKNRKKIKQGGNRNEAAHTACGHGADNTFNGAIAR